MLSISKRKLLQSKGFDFLNQQNRLYLKLDYTDKKMKIIFVDIRIFGSKVIFFIVIFRLYKCYIWLYRCYTSYTGENGEKNPKLYRLF